ncbi:HAD family hydrolase [Streptomyces sp. NPDC057696]|uniref:HAD family hydrolase n=1 Tax=Streptomyces sp. NPDC057696 TaxID=3346218 RepID=UPI003684093D
MTDVDRSRPDVPSDPQRVRELAARMARGRCVLFDFDGPLCRLFPKGSSERVADQLREIVDRSGARGLLGRHERESIDPHVVLRAVDRARPGSDLVAELEARLTAGEVAAAAVAWPTPGVDDLVRALVRAGIRIAVTTNNSPTAAAEYLRRAALDGLFSGHIHGRTDNPKLLKPDPDCLYRALRGLGAVAEDALLIGDTVTDLAAAEEARVQFVEYVWSDHEAEHLREAGASLVLAHFDLLSAMIPPGTS